MIAELGQTAHFRHANDVAFLLQLCAAPWDLGNIRVKKLELNAIPGEVHCFAEGNFFEDFRGAD